MKRGRHRARGYARKQGAGCLRTCG